MKIFCKVFTLPCVDDWSRCQTFKTCDRQLDEFVNFSMKNENRRHCFEIGNKNNLHICIKFDTENFATYSKSTMRLTQNFLSKFPCTCCKLIVCLLFASWVKSHTEIIVNSMRSWKKCVKIRCDLKHETIKQKQKFYLKRCLWIWDRRYYLRISQVNAAPSFCNSKFQHQHSLKAVNISNRSNLFIN